MGILLFNLKTLSLETLYFPTTVFSFRVLVREILYSVETTIAPIYATFTLGYLESKSHNKKSTWGGGGGEHAKRIHSMWKRFFMIVLFNVMRMLIKYRMFFVYLPTES